MTGKPYGWLDNTAEVNQLINIDNEQILKSLKVAKEEEIELIKYILMRNNKNYEKPLRVSKEIDNSLDIILYVSLRWKRDHK